MSGRAELISDEPVPEFRVVGVDVIGGVEQHGLLSVTLRDGVRHPLIERLLGEAQHPAGHRHRNTGGGKVTDQREHL